MVHADDSPDRMQTAAAFLKPALIAPQRLFAHRPLPTLRPSQRHRSPRARSTNPTTATQPAVCGSDLLQPRQVRRDERRLQQQVFRRIAGEGQLGKAARSQPASSATPRASRTRSTFPSTSPTTVSSWHKARPGRARICRSLTVGSRVTPESAGRRPTRLACCTRWPVRFPNRSCALAARSAAPDGWRSLSPPGRRAPDQLDSMLDGGCSEQLGAGIHRGGRCQRLARPAMCSRSRRALEVLGDLDREIGAQVGRRTFPGSCPPSRRPADRRSRPARAWTRSRR